MKNYSFLSEQYDSIFHENIKQFYVNICKHHNRKSGRYCLFYPSFGSSEKSEIDFIVYGQAPKGWKPEFTLSPFDERKLLLDAKEFSNTIHEGELNPIDWVNINWSKKTKEGFAENLRVDDYNAFKSLFWNITYKLISDYYKIDRNKPDWSGKIVWSNLMKIAPAERRNPTDLMYEAQLKSCIKLFKQELKEIQPKYAILLTNLSWAESFIKDLVVFDLSGGNNDIEWVGQYGDTLVIVTKRPFQGKSDNFVKEILKIIHHH